MNIFSDYTFKWYDVSILKVTMLLLGIYIGVRWPEFFREWTTVILILLLVGIAYLIAKYWPKIFR